MLGSRRVSEERAQANSTCSKNFLRGNVQLSGYFHNTKVVLPTNVVLQGKVYRFNPNIYLTAQLFADGTAVRALESLADFKRIGASAIHWLNRQHEPSVSMSIAEL